MARPDPPEALLAPWQLEHVRLSIDATSACVRLAAPMRCAIPTGPWLGSRRRPYSDPCDWPALSESFFSVGYARKSWPASRLDGGAIRRRARSRQSSPKSYPRKPPSKPSAPCSSLPSSLSCPPSLLPRWHRLSPRRLRARHANLTTTLARAMARCPSLPLSLEPVSLSLGFASSAHRPAYDRFITVWLENTDFSAAAASPTFQKLASQGILLTDYNGVTHPVRSLDVSDA